MIFTNKKAKTGKDLLDKKALAISIPGTSRPAVNTLAIAALILWFLWVETIFINRKAKSGFNMR